MSFTGCWHLLLDKYPQWLSWSWNRLLTVTWRVCRWVSGWEPCLTTWSTSRATWSPVTLMPSWCQPTPQLSTRLTNSCRGRTDPAEHHGPVQSRLIRWSHTCPILILSAQFRPEWFHFRPSPGAGFSSDVWCRTLSCPPPAVYQHWGRPLPRQRHHRPEGAVLCLAGCR